MVKKVNCLGACPLYTMCKEQPPVLQQQIKKLESNTGVITDYTDNRLLTLRDEIGTVNTIYNRIITQAARELPKGKELDRAIGIAGLDRVANLYAIHHKAQLALAAEQSATEVFGIEASDHRQTVDTMAGFVAEVEQNGCPGPSGPMLTRVARLTGLSRLSCPVSPETWMCASRLSSRRS